MDVFHNLVNAILVIVFIYALALYLRWKGTLKEEHSLILARIVTDLCLPAIIFVSLARQSIRLDQLAPPLVMLGIELTCIALAWCEETRNKKFGAPSWLEATLPPPLRRYLWVLV